MARTRPPYPPEFRQEALRLLRAGLGRRRSWRLSSDVRSRGCRTGGVRTKRIGGERADVLTSAERARLRELERENKVLGQEREILERAAAFFIRESDRP
jgi:transposase